MWARDLTLRELPKCNITALVAFQKVSASAFSGYVAGREMQQNSHFVECGFSRQNAASGLPFEFPADEGSGETDLVPDGSTHKGPAT